MLISINQIKRAYPYIDNRAIDIVMKINEPVYQTEYMLVNGKPRPKKVRLVSDIEGLFGPIEKDLIG